MKTSALRLFVLWSLIGLLGCGGVAPELEPEAEGLPTETAVSPTSPSTPADGTATSIPASEATAAANSRLEARATVAADVAEAVPPTATPALVVADLPEEILTAVFNTLTQETGLARSQVTIIQAAPVTWSDGSLGCPQPGVMYTTALVDGYHIILQEGETTYDYRVTQAGAVILCPNPANIVPPAGGTPSS